jgi:hypothetical protein
MHAAGSEQWALDLNEVDIGCIRDAGFAHGAANSVGCFRDLRHAADLLRQELAGKDLLNGKSLAVLFHRRFGQRAGERKAR